MRAPIVGCLRMTSHSSGVELAGLEQHGVRDADLAEVVQRRRPRRSARPPRRSGRPRGRACPHMRLMRSMCWPVSSSRDSAACARRRTISNWASRSSAVRSRTSPSSTADSRSRRRRSRRSARWMAISAPRGGDRAARPAARRRRRRGRPRTRAGRRRARRRRAPATSGRPRRRRGAGSAAPGRARARTTNRTSSQRGTSRSGKPCSAVQIALAWISGPDISFEPLVGRRMHVLLRRRGGADDDDLAAHGARGRTCASRTSANDSVGNVPGPPR